MFFERHEHADQELPVFFNYQIHTPGGPRYELHWHETREWIYLVKGTVEIRTNDKIEIYNEGDIVTIAPQIPHSFYIKSKMGRKYFYYFEEFRRGNRN